MLLVGGMQNQQRESGPRVSNNQSQELLSSPLTAAREGGREAKVSEGWKRLPKNTQDHKMNIQHPKKCCQWWNGQAVDECWDISGAGCSCAKN